MATPHINAEPGDIAEKILLPGDPLRAKFIAETFLSDFKLFNDVRNMLGYTGMYKGTRVSVMGTGMGAASIGIYTHELIKFYGVNQLIRVGTVGAIQPTLKLGDIILAQGAGSDSNFVKQFDLPGELCPLPDSGLMIRCIQAAKENDIALQIGQVVSSDIFYHPNSELWKKWASMGVLGLEMEASTLYLTAMHFKVSALALCTVSDSLTASQAMDADHRERSLEKMILLALETIV